MFRCHHRSRSFSFLLACESLFLDFFGYVDVGAGLAEHAPNTAADGQIASCGWSLALDLNGPAGLALAFMACSFAPVRGEPGKGEDRAGQGRQGRGKRKVLRKAGDVCGRFKINISVDSFVFVGHCKAVKRNMANYWWMWQLGLARKPFRKSAYFRLFPFLPRGGLFRKFAQTCEGGVL